VLFVCLSFSFGHCVACPSGLFFWSLCCFSFCPFILVIVLLVLLPFSLRTEGQATQWTKEKDRRTSNTMTKRKGQKDKQHNDQKKRTEGQATQ
jgi:hypothetical protein